MGWNIITFQPRGNSSPVEEFIESLEKATQAKVARLVTYLETLGPRLPLPYAKELDSGLYELRIRGRQEVRLFYCFHQQSIYLLHGFIKKSNRLPQKEISTAKKRQQDL